MYRGTTPTFTFNLPDTVDLTEADGVFVTFSRKSYDAVFTKTGEDIEVSAHQVDVYLDQKETIRLPKTVLIQLAWIYVDKGKVRRAETKIIEVTTERSLIDSEITVEDDRSSDVVGTGQAGYMTLRG